MAANQASPSLGFSRQEHWSGLPFPSPMHKSENWKWSRSVVSDSLQPHGLQPTRLLHPWDSPGKSTGVGCHCLLLYKDMWSHLKPMQIILNNPLFQDPWLNHVYKAPFATEGDIHKFQGLKSGCLLGWASQVVKNLPAKMQETQVWALEDPLEKVVATHSSILAWRIPWTEEPGGP